MDRAVLDRQWPYPANLAHYQCYDCIVLRVGSPTLRILRFAVFLPIYG